MNTDKIKKVAYKMSHLTLWEAVDNLYTIESYMNNEIFKNNFSCYQLDNFEYIHEKKEYILWGAGKDGIKVYRLLMLLNKKVVIWCDRNVNNSNKILNIELQAPQEMYSKYDNEIILIGSRKYAVEIALEIVQRNNNMKQAIFDYNRIYALNRHNKEYRKQSILSYPPLWVTIGITSACSNHCLFCSYHGNEAKEISNTYGLPFRLSYQDFIKMVDMAKAGGVPEIHICGTGEPFLNPDIFKMIDYVISKYGEVSLQTGFWKVLFDKKNYLNELIKRQKHITYISTDVLSCMAEEHDRIKVGASYNEWC